MENDDYTDINDDDADFDWYDVEPVLDEHFEFGSAMASAGWGTDEDYGYFGGDDGW